MYLPPNVVEYSTEREIAALALTSRMLRCSVEMIYPGYAFVYIGDKGLMFKKSSDECPKRLYHPRGDMLIGIGIFNTAKKEARICITGMSGHMKVDVFPTKYPWLVRCVSKKYKVDRYVYLSSMW